MSFFFLLLQTPFPNNWTVGYETRQQFATTLNPSTYKVKFHQPPPRPKQLEIYDCVLRLRSVLRVTNVGRDFYTGRQQKQALRHPLESTEGWELPRALGFQDMQVCGRNKKRGTWYESQSQKVPTTARELPSLASLVSFQGSSPNG